MRRTAASYASILPRRLAALVPPSARDYGSARRRVHRGCESVGCAHSWDSRSSCWRRGSAPVTEASKQLAPLGPAGEALLDYTLHDAAAAGFSDAVLVVAPEHRRRDGRAPRTTFVPPIAVRLVVQHGAAPRRSTPWGTAHATLVGADGLTTPFAVANADDCYGAAAIATMAAHLRSRERSTGATLRRGRRLRRGRDPVGPRAG